MAKWADAGSNTADLQLAHGPTGQHQRGLNAMMAHHIANTPHRRLTAAPPGIMAAMDRSCSSLMFSIMDAACAPGGGGGEGACVNSVLHRCGLAGEHQRSSRGWVKAGMCVVKPCNDPGKRRWHHNSTCQQAPSSSLCVHPSSPA